MPQRISKPPLRLTNPYFKSPNLRKGSYTLDETVYDYFFTHLLAGPIGPAQAMVAIFFRELYKHFTETLKLPPCYIDNGRELMAETLDNLNFNPDLKHGLSSPTPSGRRANLRPSKPSRKPNSKQQPNSRTAKGSSEKSPGTSGEETENENPIGSSADEADDY